MEALRRSVESKRTDDRRGEETGDARHAETGELRALRPVFKVRGRMKGEGMASAAVPLVGGWMPDRWESCAGRNPSWSWSNQPRTT